MPIYENNQTTNFELTKVIENCNSVNYQISKIYEFDGTTHHQIWSDTHYLLGSEENNSGKSFYSYCHNWYGNPVRCNWRVAVDATGFNKLNFDLKNSYIYYNNPDNSNYKVNSTCKVGYSTSNKSIGTNYYDSTFSNYVWSRVNNSRRTVSIDISNVNGTIYVWLGLAAGGGGITAYGTLYNVWLS